MRHAGIEPASSAWKAEVIATIRHPLETVTLTLDVRLLYMRRRIKGWWRGVDSNHRRLCQQIYSLPPLATREPLQSKRRILYTTPRAVNSKHGKLLRKIKVFPTSGLFPEKGLRMLRTSTPCRYQNRAVQPRDAQHSAKDYRQLPALRIIYRHAEILCLSRYTLNQPKKPVSPPVIIQIVKNTWSIFLGLAILMLGNGLQGTLTGWRAIYEGFSPSTTGLVMAGYFIGFLVGSFITPSLVRGVGHIRVFAALASLASASVLIQILFISPPVWFGMRLLTGACFAEVGNIDPHRLSAVGYGESRPLVANTTPANRQKNRRVEILLLTEDKKENVK